MMDLVEPFPPSEAFEASFLDLDRLLNRLEHTLLTADADAHLPKSQYERTKVGVNVEYARTLLLRLEHDNELDKIPSQKNKTKADLQKKRGLLKQIQNRLYELNQAANDDDDGEDSSSENDADAEDLLNRYAPAIPTASNSININTKDATPLSSDQANAAAAAATMSATLRSRRSEMQASDTATTTGSVSSGTTKTTRPAPGANTTPFAPRQSRDTYEANSAGNNDTLLSHHSAEQEALTTSLVHLATALKNSTKDFADTLQSSNPLVDRATAALDKSAGGMEAAGKKMGTLRKMTEGKSWWGRMALYAWIAFLWIVAILIVAVLPKLRW